MFNREIIDYKIVQETTFDDFEDEVIKLTNQGYELHGAVVVTSDKCIREMVKYKPIEPTQDKFDGWVEIDPVTRKPKDGGVRYTFDWRSLPTTNKDE